MRQLVREIRSQPQHIREIFMWLCVVVSFSIVSYFWFQSTSKQFVAFVNPEKVEAERIYAENQKKSEPSLLGNISQSLSSLKSNFSGLLGFGSNTIEFPNNYEKDKVSPNLFPVSKDK